MIVLDAVFEKSAPRQEESPVADTPEVCFVGRSNVGKSSALNALTRRHQLARVSKTPGRTRLLNFFMVTLADRPGPGRRTAAVRLCDLPGYGYAEAPKTERKTWGAMIGAYLEKRETLCAIVMLVDAEVGPQPKDLEMMEVLRTVDRPLIIAATKSDKLPRTRLAQALDKVARVLEVPRASVLPFSSHENTGLKELWNAICAASGVFGRDTSLLLGPVDESGEADESAGEDVS